MPFKRQFGFVFSDNTPNLERTIAHELGHVEPCEIPSSGALGEWRFGRAFRLRHTFSSKDFIAEPGDTKNLMDYSQGIHLYKQQWDYIHNPQAVIGWFEDDEEGEYDENAIYESFDQLLTESIGDKEDQFTFYTPAGKLVALPGNIIPDFKTSTELQIPEGALVSFKYEEDTYVAKYKESSGLWKFEGYFTTVKYWGFLFEYETAYEFNESSVKQLTDLENNMSYGLVIPLVVSTRAAGQTIIYLSQSAAESILGLSGTALGTATALIFIPLLMSGDTRPIGFKGDGWWEYYRIHPQWLIIHLQQYLLQ